MIANKGYIGNTEVSKVYLGSKLIYPIDSIINREEGLVISGEMSEGQSLAPEGTFNRKSNFTLALDITDIPPNPVGLIFESGGSSSGAYVGFNNSNEFVCRCGSGKAIPNAGVAYINNGLIEGSGTLVVNFYKESIWKVRAWWNGSPVVTPVDSNYATQWCGTGTASYLVTNENIQTGEVGTPLTGYGSASNMRYYNNQSPINLI